MAFGRSIYGQARGGCKEAGILRIHISKCGDVGHPAFRAVSRPNFAEMGDGSGFDTSNAVEVPGKSCCKVL